MDENIYSFTMSYTWLNIKLLKNKDSIRICRYSSVG